MILKDEGPKTNINFTAADLSKLALSGGEAPATGPIDRMKAQRDRIRSGRPGGLRDRPIGGMRDRPTGFPRRPGFGPDRLGRP